MMGRFHADTPKRKQQVNVKIVSRTSHSL